VTTGWLRSPNGEVAVDKPRIGSKKRWCEMNLPNYSIGRHRQLGSTANLTGIRFPDIAKMNGKRCGPVLVCGNAWNRCSVAVQMRSAHKSHRRGRYQPADFNGVSFQTWHAEGKSNFLLAGGQNLLQPAAVGSGGLRKYYRAKSATPFIPVRQRKCDPRPGVALNLHVRDTEVDCNEHF
jgi:hypothetical protein